MKTKQIMVITLAVVCLVSSCNADPFWPPPPEINVPRARQIPAIQAEARDLAWDKAAVLPPLTVSFGSGEASKLPRTEIRVMWSPEALYVRFVAEDSAIVVPYTARDADHFKGDVAEIFLDPDGSQQIWYEIEVTPHNGIFDAIHLCATVPHSGADGLLDPEIISHNVWSFKEWNCAGLRTAAREIKGGWIVELAIPPEVLHETGATLFQPGPIRANFLRYDVDKSDPAVRLFLNWSQVVVGRPHRSPARMGTLNLIP